MKISRDTNLGTADTGGVVAYFLVEENAKCQLEFPENKGVILSHPSAWAPEFDPEPQFKKAWGLSRLHLDG